MEERSAAFLQRLSDRGRLSREPGTGIGRRLPDVGMLALQQRDRRAAQRRAATRRQAPPRHPAAQAELIELLGTVVRHARGQYVVLPPGGGELETLELLDDRGKAFHALHLILAGDVLPVEEEAQEIGRADRLDLRAQLVQRVAVNACQEPSVAPLELRDARREVSAQDAPLRFQRLERDVCFGHIELQLGDRAQNLQAAGDDLQRVVLGTLEREPCAALLHRPLAQLREQVRPVRRQLGLLDVARNHQRVVHLVGRVGDRPRFLAHTRDRRRIQRTEIVGTAQLSGAPRIYRPGPALLERSVVEERIDGGVEQLVAQHRGLGQVLCRHPDLAGDQALELRLETMQIDCFLERILHRLVDERVVGDLPRAAYVVLARRRFGERGLEQVLGVHALQLIRHARAGAIARHGKRERGAPAPARLEDRRLQDRLRERLADRVGMQVAEHLVELE